MKVESLTSKHQEIANNLADVAEFLSPNKRGGVRNGVKFFNEFMQSLNQLESDKGVSEIVGPLMTTVLRKTPPKDPGLPDTSGKTTPLFDSSILQSTVAALCHGGGEKIDPTLLMKEKEYTFLWTNRVAMWRFFERYISPALKNAKDESHLLLMYEVKKLEKKVGFPINPYNPLDCFSKAFEPVMNAWAPLMHKTCRIFTENNPGGDSLKDDFLSISYIAFLHALEKQAMAILGSLPRAQGIPFSKRLEFAIRKAIRCDLPDLTGPVRVPIESEARQNMPVGISLETLFGEGPQES
jgi:hypothetical protein